MALRQETQTMRENRLISSHRFVEHFKECCTQNSERLLQMLADERQVEKDRKQYARLAPELGGFPFVV